jgi:hypothetical protein
MQCILYKIYFWNVFSYELQFDMHSYLHKNYILVKSGCYTGPPVMWQKACFILRNDGKVSLPHLRVAVPSPIPTGSSVWLGLTSTCCNPCWKSSGILAKGIDQHGNSVDFFQRRGLATSSVRSNCADVSEAKLSHPHLSYEVRQHGNQHPL